MYWEIVIINIGKCPEHFGDQQKYWYIMQVQYNV